MNKTHEDIGLRVSAFIQENFIFDGTKLDFEKSLLGSGTIDSTGILEIISFLEDTFHITFEDQELVADNFDSIARIQSFVTKKLTGTSPQ